MKTFKYFLEQAPDQEPATDATEKENSVSNQLKSKENRQKMIKKQVLLKKLQAVRAGAHKGIVAHYEPEGEMVEGWLTKKKPEKKAEKAMDAGARAKRKLARRLYADRISGSEDNVPDNIREGYAKPNKELPKGSKVHVKKGVKVQGKYVKEASVALDANTAIRNVERKEKLKRINKTLQAMRKNRDYHPLLHSPKGGATAADLRGEEVVVGEAKVDDVKYSKDEKRKNYETDVHTLSVNKGVRADRNKRRSATDVVFHGHSKVERDRKQAHYKSRGVKKVKGVKEEVVDEGKKKGLWDNIHAKRKRGEKPAKPGDKDYPKTLNVEGEDKAYNYVVSQLKKKYGDGVLTKRDKIKPQSAAEKARIRAHNAKIAAQDTRDDTEKASSGRYTDRSRTD